MTEPNDVQSSLDRMRIHMELRGLRLNTASTFARCARRFLARTDKAPADVTSTDVESFLLDLVRKGRSPRTRNVNLAAVRCLLGATTGSNATAGVPRAKVPRRSPEKSVWRARQVALSGPPSPISGHLKSPFLASPGNCAEDSLRRRQCARIPQACSFQGIARPALPARRIDRDLLGPRSS